jgi:DNA sulfur modification protein DndD
MISSTKKNDDQKQAGIELSFVFSHAGKTHEYFVRREWSFNPKFSEILTVKKDGNLLSEIEMDQWQDLLNELIPPRFSRLFLFDGEKIQNLVDDSSDNIYLRDSFKSLLGLDIIERLKTDLGIYLNRRVKNKELNQITQQKQDLESQIKEVDNNKSDLLQERAQIQSRFDQIQSEIEQQEAIVASEGGGFARKRESLKSEKNHLDEKIISIENEIRDLCAGLYPFAITPKYCTLLKNQLIKEDTIQALSRSQILIKSNIANFDQSLHSKDYWNDVPLTADQKETINQRISTLLHHHFDITTKNEPDKLIHYLSQYEFQKVIQWIDEALEKVPTQIKNQSKDLENLHNKRQKVVEMINKAPSDDIIGPLMQKLNELNQNLGQLTEKLHKLDELIKELDYKLKELEREKKKQEEELLDLGKDSDKVHLANKVTAVLDDYISELQQQKISILSENVLDCFSRLLRKEEYIKNIVIDDKYRITLYDEDGNAIPKEQLSAGEKEIFAISLLWGLTLTSGRQLPFIVDTPLGRLDSDHRGNLVMDFFQHAGDQMIIFSTDTEIDKEYFRILQPHIARAYHLNYSKKDRFTRITPGYFWQKEEVGVEE